MPNLNTTGKKKGSWSEDNMKQALNSMLLDKMSVREASRIFNVPKSTLQDRIAKLKNGGEIQIPPKLGRFERTFCDSYEEQLMAHIKELDGMLMPLTKKEFLKLAFDLAESLKLPHRFNRDNKAAGKNFYYDFMKRHPELALRTPESTSMMRAVGFNKPQVALFFENLRRLLEKYSFPASRIFNADETGVSSVHENSKVLSMKGKRQVGKLTSGERGRNITLMFCMSAIGQYIPPLFIFPRQKMNQRLMIGAPEESIGVAQPNGWMNGNIFLTWLKHFEKHVHPTEQSPVLLVLDGHCSHKELEVIRYARAHHIHMLSTPPHTTHKLQPLDRSFMKPFKGAYAEACSFWMRKNPGVRINEYNISELVSTSYSRICRLEIAQKGFACTGIHPFDSEIFSDLDFLPSRMTDVQHPGEAREPEVQMMQSQTSGNENPRPVPSDSRCTSILQKISPLPDASKRRLEGRKRKAQRSEILTSTPFKQQLQAKHDDKVAKETNRRLKPRSKCSKSLDFDCPSTSSQPDEEETNCILCGESFDEDWIQCQECKGWAHENCSSVEGAALFYKCDMCLKTVT